VILRAPTAADVPAVTAMMNVRGVALHGRPEMTEEELRGWFTLPSVDLEQDVRIALDGAGDVLGYADLGDQAEDGTRLWVDLRVAPAEPAQRALEPLLDAMEARAREKATDGAVIRAVADDRDGPYRALLEERAYRIVRASFHMSVDFAGAPADASPPDGVTIRPYRSGEEERAVHEVVMEAFGDGWDFTPQPFEEFLHWATAMNSDPTLWWVAQAAGELTGACVCRPTAHGDEARGWVETLAVRKPWRGQGLGRALLLTAFGEFHRRGQTGAALSVDTANVTGAVRLYESVGMHATRRLDTYERALDA
jgi:mycothiol synthase